ncbi:MAG: GntR family transcriptional regulator [Kiritimatiellae bacterium]|nr:GntR family transcriptional regulator [Kiritimatiellia bacterium]
MMVNLPFEIDKASGKGLVELTADGIRRAILDGAYAVGEVLPTQGALARALGVSIRVTREALARLAEEGLVSARGRRGTVVLPLGTRRWKGRIVYLHSPYVGSYHFARFGETLAGELAAAGWLFSSTTVPLPADAADRSVDAFVAAHCRDADLVLVRGCADYAVQAVDACGVPWISLVEKVDGDFRNCKGMAPSSVIHAVPEFALHCRMAGVRRVVAMNLRPQPDIEGRLARAGIAYESWIVRPRDPMVLENYPQGAMEGMFERYGRAPRDLPDLFLFTDDYLARGALVALVAMGVRVPDDVRVATLVNKGFAPAFPVSLTRSEIDPVRCGEAAARCVLSYLSEGRLPDDVVVSYAYIKGASFP